MKKVKEGYKMTELGEIPNEWRIGRLQDIAELIDGDRSSNYPSGDDIVSNGIVFLSTANIKNDKLVFEECRYITKEKFDSLKKGKLQDKDIIITLRGTLGNIGYFKANKFATGLINAQMMIIRKNTDVINSDYLYKYMTSELIKNQIKSISTGSAQPQLTKKDMSIFKVVIPPILEQQKIADILSTVDEQIDNVDRLIEKTKELKKGLMQQLLTKGIGHTEFKETEVGVIPKEWEVKTLGELITDLKSGLSRNLKDEDVGIPCIRSSNIVDFRIDHKDLKYWYLEDDKGANIQDYVLKNGEILVNFINSMAQIGKCCIYKSNGRSEIYTTNILKMNFKEENLLNVFFYYISQTDYYFKQVGLITNQAVNQASFTTNDFKKIRIQVPSLDEQKKIVNKLETTDIRLDDLQNKKEKLQQLKKGLMQQLLTGKIRVKVDEV